MGKSTVYNAGMDGCGELDGAACAMKGALAGGSLLLSACVLSVWVSTSRAEVGTDVSEPWSVSDAAPVLPGGTGEAPQASARAASDSVGSVFCYGLLRFYQVYLPALTRSRCPMYPSCSRFGLLAIAKHGPFLGIAMTADRLMHEGSETKIAPMVCVDGRFLCFDPVESNDFWWQDR